MLILQSRHRRPKPTDFHPDLKLLHPLFPLNLGLSALNQDLTSWLHPTSSTQGGIGTCPRHSAITGWMYRQPSL